MNSEMHLPTGFLFVRQVQHVLILALLVPGTLYLARPALNGTNWLGITDSTWFYLLIILLLSTRLPAGLSSGRSLSFRFSHGYSGSMTWSPGE